MAEINVKDNGPLFVQGDITLTDGEGKEMETKKSVALCRCGLSDNKPFCDGGHMGEFESKVRA